MRRARWIAALCVAFLVTAGFTAWVVACGPFTTTLSSGASVPRSGGVCRGQLAS